MSGMASSKSLFSNLLSTHTRLHVTESPNWITCTTDGIICSVSDSALAITEYDRNVLVGKFIGILMSPFMSYLHRHILLPRYKDATPFQRNMMHLFLRGKSYRRPLIIYTLRRTPIYVEISVSPTSAEPAAAAGEVLFMLSFVVKNDFRDSNVYMMSSLETKLFPHFRETKNDVVIANIGISIDTKSDAENVATFCRYHDAIVEVIKRNFYPYIYIYEMTNFGCVLVSNLCCSYNMPRYCASLMVCCLNNIWNETLSTDVKLNSGELNIGELNIGVSYGKCQIGALSNGDVRIFGVTYDEANMCRQWVTAAGTSPRAAAEIVCTYEYSYKLTMEKIYRNPLFEKSFTRGQLRCNRIDLSTIDNSILREKSFNAIAESVADSLELIRDRGSKTDSHRSSDNRLAETRLLETRSVETRSAETRLAETRLVETRSAEPVTSMYAAERCPQPC